MPDQSGRVVLITGATTGPGPACARALSTAGATLVLAVPDPARGARLAAALPGPAQVLPLDLTDLASVRACADRLHDRIDVVLAYAACVHLRGGSTVDGFEVNMAANHLGHFALAARIMPLVTDRYVAVTSTAHRRARIDLDTFARPVPPGPGPGTAAYAASRLATVLFAAELDRRLRAHGSPVRALVADPGYTAPALSGDGVFARATLSVGAVVAARSGAGAARTLLHAATADLPGGSHVEHRRTGWRVRRAAGDPVLAAGVWQRSAALTGADRPPGTSDRTGDPFS